MNSKHYKEELKVNKDIMELSLYNLRNSYVSFKMNNTPEYNKIYNNHKANVEKHFQDLFILKNNLIKGINNSDTNIRQVNKNINRIKKNLLTKSKKLQQIKNINLASTPRRENTESEMNKTYTNLLLLSAGCLATIYISHKVIKSY